MDKKPPKKCKYGKTKAGTCRKKRGKTKRYSLDYFKIFGKKK